MGRTCESCNAVFDTALSSRELLYMRYRHANARFQMRQVPGNWHIWTRCVVLSRDETSSACWDASAFLEDKSVYCGWKERAVVLI